MTSLSSSITTIFIAVASMLNNSTDQFQAKHLEFYPQL
jgi:hypothetical protein